MRAGKIIILIIIVFVIYIVYWAFGFGEIPDNSVKQALTDYRYHFMMITRVTDEAYWKRLYSGTRAVADKEKITLEYYSPRFLNLKELERYLEMAVLSKVDGILLSVPNEPSFLSLINEATEKNIPVVALFNEFEHNEKNSFVGINTYDLGFKTGKTLIEATAHIRFSPDNSSSQVGLSQIKKSQVQVAVLVTSSFSSYNYNEYMKGLRTAIKEHTHINLNLIIKSKGGSISAEEQTQSILKNHPEIQAIVCSDVSDTVGVAKVVVDLNRVSQITIIGSGLNSEIVKYIKLKVISGVLTEDPYELGAQGMLALIRLKQNRSRKETYHTPIFLVDSENVDRMYNNLIK